MPEKDVSTSTATETGAGELQQRFAELAARWKQERGPYSSSARLAAHPAYQEIIALGAAAIPLLLRELDREPDHWFRALHALTGADPVPPTSRGKVREMAEAWLHWGREQGYKW
jgi:hypothetical protein